MPHRRERVRDIAFARRHRRDRPSPAGRSDLLQRRSSNDPGAHAARAAPHRPGELPACRFQRGCAARGRRIRRLARFPGARGHPRYRLGGDLAERPRQGHERGGDGATLARDPRAPAAPGRPRDLKQPDRARLGAARGGGHRHGDHDAARGRHSPGAAAARRSRSRGGDLRPGPQCSRAGFRRRSRQLRARCESGSGRSARIPWTWRAAWRARLAKLALRAITRARSSCSNARCP